jgi:hypothetical protein
MALTRQIEAGTRHLVVRAGALDLTAERAELVCT